MTKLLETVVDRLHELPEMEQDAIAERILADLEDEVRWDESFFRSQDALRRLADKARADVRAGKSHAIGIDEL